MSTIVIIPGGFHPFHAGHMSLYNAARKAFPDAQVYVAATNSQEERPFPFAIKEKLAKVSGVKPGSFVQVKSPFQAKEITQHYDPENDILIFVRSEKDRNESPKPGGMKKDGTPAYFQPYTGENLAPFSKHAYFAYLPTVKFGPGIQSATEIRKAWPTLDDRRKTAMVMSLYPATQKNPKLAINVVAMLDQVMGGQINEGSLTEIGYSDHLGELNVPDSKVIANATQEGTISQRPVMKYEQGNTTVFFFAEDEKISSLVLISDGNKLRAIKNFTGQSEQVYALVNYIVNIANTRLVITPDEPLTKEGFQWISRMIKNPTGLKITDTNDDSIDMNSLRNEWLKSKSVHGSESGDTGIVISESSQEWKTKLQENESRLMPHIYFDMSSNKKDIVENKRKESSDSFDAIDPETDRFIKYAQQHYPNAPSKQQAFIKYVQRALKHSEEEDTEQDSKINQLSKEIEQLKQAVAQTQVVESRDYIDEK